MLALHFDKMGSLHGLKLKSVPRCSAGAGQVVVAVHAAGLNPSDVKNVLGRFPYTTVPRTPGRDFAGVVIDGAAELVGLQVWGTGRDLGFDRDGSHAEFVVVPSNGIALLPVGLTMTDAASAGVPYTTALEALDRLEVKPGDALLVLGSGAVAIATAVLARHRGAEPLIVVRARERVTDCESAGFAAIFVPEGEALPSSAAIFDTTGHRLPDAILALQQFGRVAVIAAPPSGTVEVPLLTLYRKGGSIIGVNSLLHDSVECAAMLDSIGPALKSPLPGPAVRQVEIERGVEAYRSVEKGDRAKFVLTTPAIIPKIT